MLHLLPLTCDHQLASGDPQRPVVEVQILGQWFRQEAKAGIRASP